MNHPLLDVLLAAAGGRFPPVDGAVGFLPGWRPGVAAVVAFTGHAYVASDDPDVPAALTALGVDGFGAATAPEALLRLAGPGGEVGVLDATLVAHGTGTGGRLTRRTDLDAHPRVAYARRQRDAVRVFADGRGLVTLARGLAGRTELSVEVAPGRRGEGIGRTLVADALALVPVGEPVFAAVSPGNARSLRAFLACGFVVVGAEVVVHTATTTPVSAP